MTQQYGFRASNNLSEVLDRNACWDNLSIDRRDLPLLIGTSAAGVVANDYQAIIGLTSGLELQTVAITSAASSQLSAMSVKATKNGDTFTGPIVADFINNDRPYTTQSGAIIGPSTISYFSPASGGVFSSGGQYKLGPVTASTITTSGVNYTGPTQQWSSLFARYKNFATVQEQPSWTDRRIPLFLPPPTAINGCVMWLDAEYSEFELDGAGAVVQWKGVGGGPVAAQSIIASRPLLVTNVMAGRPAVRFDGTNDALSMGNIGSLFPNGATLVIKARVLDTDYNIFSTLNNTSCRWNDGGNMADLGVFTTTVQSDFHSLAERNGTFTFAVRCSAAFGLEMRENSVRIGYKASGFTYTGGDTYIIGTAPGGAGAWNGDLHSFALFNRVLTDKEVRTVEEYFAWRYDGVYDPERTQFLQLEDFATIDLEDGTPITA